MSGNTRKPLSKKALFWILGGLGGVILVLVIVIIVVAVNHNTGGNRSEQETTQAESGEEIFEVVEEIMSDDYERTEGERAVMMAKEADKRLKTIGSAVEVYNIASYYGDTETMEEYDVILIERQKAAGIDVDMESEG